MAFLFIFDISVGLKQYRIQADTKGSKYLRVLYRVIKTQFRRFSLFKACEFKQLICTVKIHCAKLQPFLWRLSLADVKLEMKTGLFN